MAARADLNGLKESIQNTLVAQNTTTGSPIDLSSGLLNSKRVQQVLKINPEMIIPQPSFFPLVTCYVTDKSIIRDDIASSQLNTKRRARVAINIVGTLWNSNFVTLDEDPADEDIVYLMENIELIMRSNYNLSATCSWQMSKACEYFTSILDEDVHLRSGILKIECEVFY